MDLAQCILYVPVYIIMNSVNLHETFLYCIKVKEDGVHLHDVDPCMTLICYFNDAT